MNPTEAQALVELVRRIRDAGITVLLIEHRMEVVMGVSDVITVLDSGEAIARGTPEEVQTRPARDRRLPRRADRAGHRARAPRHARSCPGVPTSVTTRRPLPRRCGSSPCSTAPCAR